MTQPRKVWLTHPQLTPGHDFECLPAAVGTWMGSGWVPREDQSTPPAVDVPADPREQPEPASESPATSGSSKSSPLPRKES